MSEEFTMPEPLAELAEKKGFTDLGQFAKSYQEMESAYTKTKQNAIMLPEERTPENMAPIYQKLGRPETPDGYKVDIEGIDQTRVDGFKKVAFDYGLPADAFSNIVKSQYEMETATIEKLQKDTESQVADANKKFRESLGENPDDVISEALALADKVGVREYLKENDMENDPVALTILTKVRKLTSEDSIPITKGSQSLSPKDELATLMKSDAMKNRMHPEHAKAHERFLELNRQMARQA